MGYVELGTVSRRGLFKLLPRGRIEQPANPPGIPLEANNMPLGRLRAVANRVASWGQKDDLSRRDAIVVLGATGLVALGANVLKPPKPVSAEGADEEAARQVALLGANSPWSQEHLEEELRAQSANSEAAGVEPNRTFGVTIYLWNRAYRSLLADCDKRGETIQRFMLRHAQRMAELLQGDGNDFLRENNLEPPFGGFEIPRVVVVQDRVRPPQVNDMDYPSNRFPGETGAFTFYQDYVPSEADYFNRLTNTDWGFIHELGHFSGLYLYDRYKFNVGNSGVQPWANLGKGLGSDPSEIMKKQIKKFTNRENANALLALLDPNRVKPILVPANEVFAGVLPRGQTYDIAKRSRGDPFRRSLMSTCDPRFTPDEAFFAWEHMKGMRDPANHGDYVNASYDPPYRVPKNTIFSFGDNYGGAKLEVFQAWGNYGVGRGRPEIRWNRVHEGYLNGQGAASIGDPYEMMTKIFNNGKPMPIIPAPYATLFVKVTTADDKVHWAWRDPGEFATAVFKGYKDTVVMGMNLDSADLAEGEYDTAVSFSMPVAGHMPPRK